MPKAMLGPVPRPEQPWTPREVALLTVLVEELNVVRVALGLSELPLEKVQRMVEYEATHPTPATRGTP